MGFWVYLQAEGSNILQQNIVKICRQFVSQVKKENTFEWSGFSLFKFLKHNWCISLLIIQKMLVVPHKICRYWDLVKSGSYSGVHGTWMWYFLQQSDHCNKTLSIVFLLTNRSLRGVGVSCSSWIYASCLHTLIFSLRLQLLIYEEILGVALSNLTFPVTS